MAEPVTLTYPELFPIGTRVVIRAGEHEGTDHRFNRREGVIERWFGCSTASVRFDRPVSGLPNPYGVVAHTLRKRGEV